MAVAPSTSRINELAPPGRWSALQLGDLWRYHELLYILAWRNVKVRYKQAVLGGIWAVLQPLVLMGAFTLLFTRVATVSTQGIPYAVYAYTGLVPWTLFSNAMRDSSESLVSNVNLVSKVSFPRLVIPAGAVLAWTPDFVISSAVLFLIMAIVGTTPAWTAVLLPAVMAAAMITAFSVGVWLSALNVAYRDVRYVVPFITQVGLFITPVAYPTTALPESLRWIAAINPMTWVIDLSRWALLGTSTSWTVAAFSFATCLLLLVTGLYYFRKVEHYFADVI
jgi:lipopolysaccharide transport system permease protein